jgi:hypothetical protein
MFSYESGLLIAFLLFIYGTTNVFVQVNSRMERNLNKVGMRLSWLSLNPKEMTSDTDNPPFTKKLLKFLAIVLLGFVMIFLSWIQVFLFVAGFFYRFNKDSGAPAYVKEYRWKLKNVDLSFDGMAREMFTLAEKQGTVNPKSDEEREMLFLDFKKGIVDGMLNRGLLVQLMKIKPEIAEFYNIN